MNQALGLKPGVQKQCPRLPLAPGTCQSSGRTWDPSALDPRSASENWSTPSTNETLSRTRARGLFSQHLGPRRLWNILPASWGVKPMRFLPSVPRSVLRGQHGLRPGPSAGSEAMGTFREAARSGPTLSGPCGHCPPPAAPHGAAGTRPPRSRSAELSRAYDPAWEDRPTSSVSSPSPLLLAALRTLRPFTVRTPGVLVQEPIARGQPLPFTWKQAHSGDGRESTWPGFHCGARPSKQGCRPHPGASREGLGS